MGICDLFATSRKWKCWSVSASLYTRRSINCKREDEEGKEGGINEGEGLHGRSAGSRNNKLQPPGEGDAGHAVDYPPGAPPAKPPASRACWSTMMPPTQPQRGAWTKQHEGRIRNVTRNRRRLKEQGARHRVRGHARIDLKSIRTSAAMEESIDTRRHDGGPMRILEARF